MKKVATFICLALTLTLTACPEDTSIGSEDDFNFKESTSPSPKPTKSSVKPSKSPTKRPSSQPPKSNYKPTKYYINIENPYDSYDPNERVLRQGDILIFTNKDPQNKHSLTEGAQKKKNPLFDSGVLSTGEKYTFTKVDTSKWPPGEYMFHCEVVPYMQTAGPIKVLDNPAL